MTANGAQPARIVPERRPSLISARLILRILVALIISSIIVMAFFVTAVVSH